MSDRKLATMMLNAVWNEDVRGLRRVLRMGADPNWIFNGYPILIHAVFTRNEKIMMLLIKAGAVQVEEALGFALDRCVGEMIFPLWESCQRRKRSRRNSDLTRPGTVRSIIRFLHEHRREEL